MGHYVYQYLHPEYGHLYCGRTKDLDKRIYSHNNLKTDNIPREYEPLLRESIIMYIELQNKAQEIAVEAYCIDKYKPHINKVLKYNDGEMSTLEMKLPKWKLYEVKNLELKKKLNIAKKEKEQIIEDISNIENDIKIKKDNLNRIKFELKKLNYETKMQEYIQDNSLLFSFCNDDIKWFYKYCENKHVKFHSEIYDRIGNSVAGGCIYYDFEKDIITLEHWNKVDKTTKDNPRKVTEKELFFDLITYGLYDFYPDINIYPELYVTLLTRKDELLITNAEYDIKDLMTHEKCSSFFSVDRNVIVEFKNEEIIYCRVASHEGNYKGNHNNLYSINSLVNSYIWDKKNGVTLVDEDQIIYQKEELDPGIKNYILSCKFHHPNRNEKEEEYCNQILAKYNIDQEVLKCA